MCVGWGGEGEEEEEGEGEGVVGVGVVCVVCMVQMTNNTACQSRRVREMHLIGWQNTWERAPGVPATPSPP